MYYIWLWPVGSLVVDKAPLQLRVGVDAVAVVAVATDG